MIQLIIQHQSAIVPLVSAIVSLTLALSPAKAAVTLVKLITLITPPIIKAIFIKNLSKKLISNVLLHCVVLVIHTVSICNPISIPIIANDLVEYISINCFILLPSSETEAATMKGLITNKKNCWNIFCTTVIMPNTIGINEPIDNIVPINQDCAFAPLGKLLYVSYDT